MRSRIIIATILSPAIFLLVGCASSGGSNSAKEFSPRIYFESGETISIMPFETESALSNLGGQLSDEVTAELLAIDPKLKIVPASVTTNFLASNGLVVGGLPSEHAVHQVREGLKCRYLLTGNLYTSLGEIKYTALYSSRIANGNVTVRFIDCDSNNVLWAGHIETSYSTTTYYQSGQPIPTAFLTDGQLISGLLGSLGIKISEKLVGR